MAAATTSPPEGAAKAPEDKRITTPLLESHHTVTADVLEGSGHRLQRKGGEEGLLKGQREAQDFVWVLKKNLYKNRVGIQAPALSSYSQSGQKTVRRRRCLLLGHLQEEMAVAPGTWPLRHDAWDFLPAHEV